MRRGSTARSLAPSFVIRTWATIVFRALRRTVRSLGNDASRADPARGSRKPSPTPANPRNARFERPALAGNPRLSPLSPGSAMTGLSRRRSRVRVPSLPSHELPAERLVLAPNGSSVGRRERTKNARTSLNRPRPAASPALRERRDARGSRPRSRAQGSDRPVDGGVSRVRAGGIGVAVSGGSTSRAPGAPLRSWRTSLSAQR